MSITIFIILKDENPIQLTSGVVYSTQCQCNKEYIGQTTIYLETVKMILQNTCALIQHNNNKNNQYKFNFEDTSAIKTFNTLIPQTASSTEVTIKTST